MLLLNALRGVCTAIGCCDGKSGLVPIRGAEEGQSNSLYIWIGGFMIGFAIVSVVAWLNASTALSVQRKVFNDR